MLLTLLHSECSRVKESWYFTDEEEYDNGGDKIYEHLSNLSSGSSPTEDEAPKKISTLEMFGKSGTVLRALWAEMPEVDMPFLSDIVLNTQPFFLTSKYFVFNT